MSWKRHYSVVGKTNRYPTTPEYNNNAVGSSNNYSSILPEIYSGHPERINRYSQYDQMDDDSQIYAALNTIADFSTQSDPTTSSLFQVKYHGNPTDSEVDIIKAMLQKWSDLNQFKKRMWRIFRNVIKYGDQIMIRDPETLEWYHIPPNNVQSVIINEAKGREPEVYVVQDLDVTIQTLTAGNSTQYGSNIASQGTNSLQNPMSPGNFVSPGRTGSYNTGNSNTTFVDAENIIHLSLSEGLDAGWPFGTSILESVYRDFKQKQLLEDAIMIYRIQRAPERRVFYVDVGTMPPHKAQAWVERVKNEMHQRRLPSRTGGGSNVTDAAYNPMSMIEDFWFPQRSDGRGSKVTTLPGGEGLGNIDDLNYFNNKLAAGLGVPQSYLTNPGSADQGASFTDGRIGTAYIQEFRFSEYCQRLQRLIEPVFDKEFKLFLKQKGCANIDSSLFDLELNTPQHFSDYAKIEKQQAQIALFTQLADMKMFSKRWLLMNYLGLTPDEISQNMEMWREENPDAVSNTGDDGISGGGGGGLGGLPDLGSMGMDDGENFDSDFSDGQESGGDLMGGSEESGTTGTSSTSTSSSSGASTGEEV